MKFASKEKLNELYKLENEYFELKDTKPSETARCLLRGELVKGFVKSEEKVNEAIEKLTIKNEELKNKKVEIKTEKKKLPKGVVEAKFEGFDAETNEIIHVGDWIAKTDYGWSKVEHTF